MKKLIILFLSVFILPACYFHNMNKLNICDTLTGMSRRENRMSNEEEEIVCIKKVYRLKNGLIIDKYNDQYGYWYMVKSGDSLYGLARRSGISVRLLSQVNKLTMKSQLKYKAFLFIPMKEDYLDRTAECVEVSLKKNDFIWPIYGYVKSSFGLRQWGWRKKFHRGIDLPAPIGTKVFCSAAGVVDIAARDSKYGNYIIIDHQNNFKTVYAHLDKILVERGEEIEQGQVIGLVGNTGRTTGPHLHFEVRINNYPVNPNDYLQSDKNEISELYDYKYKKANP